MAQIALDISVVICAYTEARWNDLVAAVRSVQCQSAPPREIITVIDHNPKLLERVQANIPGVVTTENQGMSGVSEARNSGVAVAKGQVIVFLDDDAEALPDWLEQISTGYTDPNVLGVGGAMEPIWLNGRPKWFPDEFGWVIGATYKGIPDVAALVRNVWSGNMSVRREIFESIGGFRIGFGKVDTRSSPEDTDFCIRALQRWPQGVWLYRPEAKVRHKVPAGRASWRYFQWRCFNEGLGKAQLTSLVRPGNALRAEWTYTYRILPRGVMRGVQDAIFRRDLAGLARSAAIVFGWVITTAGYVTGLASIAATRCLSPTFKHSAQKSAS
jgi:GT2 family glycosyltransferase